MNVLKSLKVKIIARTEYSFLHISTSDKLNNVKNNEQKATSYIYFTNKSQEKNGCMTILLPVKSIAIVQFSCMPPKM